MTNNKRNDEFEKILEEKTYSVKGKIGNEQWAQNYEEFFAKSDGISPSFKEFYIYRRENSLGNIDALIKYLEWCEKNYGYQIYKIEDRKTSVDFTLKDLEDPKNKIFIMKGGDWDIFSDKEPYKDKFIEGYKKCAKNCEKIIVMVDSRFLKGGFPQVEENINILKECLDGSSYKLVYEGTPIRATVFIKRNGSASMSLWRSRVKGERTEGFPHRPEISTYQGVILLSEENDINNYFFQNIEISREQLDNLESLLRKLQNRNDILISEKNITFLSYPEYLERLAEIAGYSY